MEALDGHSDDETKEVPIPSLVGTVGSFGLRTSRIFVEGTAGFVRRRMPSQVSNVAVFALVRTGLRAPAPLTPEQEDRSHLELIEASMQLRIPIYEWEYQRRQEIGEDIYMLESRGGVRPQTLFDDAKAWIHYANFERNPHPTAGHNQHEHIATIGSCLAAWGLSHNATEALMADLYREYGINDARDPQYQANPVM